MIKRLSTTQELPEARMPEPQEGRQRALLEGSDECRRPCQLPFPAVHERHPGVGRLLELLQDQTQRLLEQSSHQCRFEGRPEDRASAEHAQHVRGERAPITRRDLLRRQSLVLDGNHRSLALVTVQKIDELYDPTLRDAMHRQEQWQP
jgi:hypothetical protein